jgi:hypothetical protein
MAAFAKKEKEIATMASKNTIRERIETMIANKTTWVMTLSCGNEGQSAKTKKGLENFHGGKEWSRA